MSAEGIIRWLITEAVLGCVLMLVLWAIGKWVTDGEAKKWLSLICIVIIGGTMLILLLRFVGVV